MNVKRLSLIEFDRSARDLTALLADAVDTGASVGWVAPARAEPLAAFWASVREAMAGGNRVVLGAWDAEGRLAGTVQIDLAMPENGAHRAEVRKLLVHSRARRQGLGRALMEAAEAEARAAGRRLLVLDTLAGDAGEALYVSLGWHRAGMIPGYAQTGPESYGATVFFYKELS